ncbi:telomere-associated RIF1 isoform X2 [Pelobates cultripes]|uniref:Telomere-associated RIF1 isoform X2 n=1 Tax=Pelobates cultripes TaxID=61616 RepID=A0AAD1SMP9_PELCU|nr:telomere-associated RIF1 isoform X2 [Pelobates cultripes]
MAVCSEESRLLPLLETLEDSSCSHTEQTDAYLSLVSRISGEDSKEFMVLVEGKFQRLCKVFKAHISHANSDLGNAALQALGFCVFNSKIASGLSAPEIEELILTLNSIAAKGTDKNRCTRALWVISKQSFSSEEVGKAVPSILSTLESVLNKDVQSLVIEYEALNVIIRLLDQAPTQMTDEAVRWAKLIIPLVVHSAPKVRLRSATALEIGMPVLLKKQQEVAVVTEQLMSSKILAEMQKLFASKNETYVLKLWPLFVKLLGKTLHRSGTFINSLLQLEELGFRSGSPAVKKIAFIAWKSLIDNFALNPDILCSTKRLKLLMQPLSSIHVRTEALALTKIEVWWYLLMRLGSQLHLHFEQVCLPLIQSALSVESSTVQSTPLRASNQSITASTPLQKGTHSFSSPTTPKISLNSSLLSSVAFPSVHLLGIEMMLHFLLGPEVVKFANQHKLVLSLEPLQHPLISSSSFFCKHAAVLLASVQDGFIVIGKDASGVVVNAIWKDLIDFAKAAMDTGNKKDRQGSEVLTHLLQALKNIITSDVLQVEKSMNMLECTVKGLPQKILGSAAYQGTPALFLIQLHFHGPILEHGISSERYFINFETLVNYVLSGQTSPLAFSESVFVELNQCAKVLEKEALWRMWSILINPLTDRINQTNEVNQGDALEHNFSAMHSSLMLPISHIFPIPGFPQPTMKTLMRTWSELYKAFARCAALVTTTEENVCCEELCSRILSVFCECPSGLQFLERIVQVVTIIVECFNFSPYTTKFQPKTKAPHTPTDWSKRKKEPLGNLNSLLKLFIQIMDCFHTLSADESVLETSSQSLVSVGGSVIGALSTCISHITLPSLLRMVFVMLTKPISLFFDKTKSESSKVYSSLGSKLDKFIADGFLSLGSRYTGSYDSELLEALSPLLCAIFLHKNKQIRNQVAQFWNGSFGKATGLLYPEELKPVLNQVKSKTPLLLPGFTYSNSTEELSGPYSDNTDNSQLETKISGIEVKSAGKRDSLLSRAEELKDKETPIRPSQAKVKLDFSSPKRKLKLLEEEQSVDFVFIPPETKERVLTEHQKEVLRTKRVDIPTMYNNLDASQDTNLFSQYSQSQENSSEKTAGAEELKDRRESKENMPETLSTEQEPNKGTHLNADVEMLDNKEQPPEVLNESIIKETEKESQNSSNVSNSSVSSDMVLGTPPQPTSRRQSFITLEKFDHSPNRTFSPVPIAKFPKAAVVTLVPDSQEAVAMESDENKDGSLKDKESLNTKLPKSVSKRRKPKISQMSENTEDKRSASEELNPESTNESLTKIDAKREERKDSIPDSETQEKGPKPVENSENTLVGNCASKNVESKENTPPETGSNSQNENSQAPSTNQISLRRSSRRQSEIIEVVRSENVSQRREQTKNEEKSSIQKKGAQSKENLRQQQQEKVEKRQSEEDNILDHTLTQNSLSESKIDEKAKTAGVNQSEEVTDSNVSRESQEVTRSRPRYQTRRSLQALKTGVENSESDNSETREENGKRRRTSKSKPKSADLSGKDDHSASTMLSEMENNPKAETLSSLKNIEPVSGKDLEVDGSQTTGLDNKTCAIVMENVGANSIILDKASLEPVHSLFPEENKTYDITKNDPEPSLSTKEENKTYDITKNDPEPSSKKDYKTFDITKNDPDPSLGTREENKTYDITKNDPEPSFHTKVENKTYSITENAPSVCSTIQSLLTEPATDDFSTAVSDVFLQSESKLAESPDCPHKRSRRVKRSKSCDCCSEISLNQHKSVTEETIKARVPPNICVSNVSSADLQFDDTLFSGPCAVSTPLVMENNDPCFFKPSVSDVKYDTESEQEHTVVPLSEGSQAEITQVCVLTKTVVDPVLPELIGEESLISVQSESQPESTNLEINNAQAICADNEEPPAWNVNLVPINCKTFEVVTTVSTMEEVNEEMESEMDKSEVVVENDSSKTKPMEESVSALEPDSSMVRVQEQLEDMPAVQTEECSAPAEIKKHDIEGVLDGRFDTDSPPKIKGLVALTSANDSPSGYCSWSPSASPSTSILKKGIKRQQDNDSPSPINKIRRVSFADPIYQEGLADDIDRRSPVIRSHNSSPSSRSLKMLTASQPKLNTTPTKGFLSPGSRTLGIKSSKKNLISEMTKESMPSPKESVYPALMNCTTPIDVILPQITSNMWARGLGQLIRAKNIKTVGDLSTLTPSEIKTLPIRSPKISTVKKALRVYHEQQTKSKGFDLFAVLGETEKPLNGIDEKTSSADEEKLATDLIEQSATDIDTPPTPDILSQIAALSLQLSTEDLGKYSGSQLFEMQDKLAGMSGCILKHLQSQWRSPPHSGSV